MKLYIGLHGPAGSGKSTAAAVLQEMGLEAINLADPMKRFVQEIFQPPDETLWGDSQHRSRPVRELGFASARQALQLLGTEWARSFDPDVWVRYLLRTTKENEGKRYSPKAGFFGEKPAQDLEGFVVGDVRFRNEAILLRMNGYCILRILRGDIRKTEDWRRHPSEDGLPAELCDATIVNDKSIDEFRQSVRDFVSEQMKWRSR